MASSRVIMHFDGDAFFSSVEQAKDYRLKGKPVITGGERGIAASMSYEAKARGVTRGMNIWEIKKVCPEAIILPSDYEMYCIYARRMYNIVRRYTPRVEEYSIDECFADITGMDKAYGMSYEELGLKIKKELELKLGITFGVGMGPNKVLAKVASKHKKPAGFTIINQTNIVQFTKELGIHKVWGIGASMSMYLRQRDIVTAYDFATKDDAWLRVHSIAKPYKEIWYELQGKFVKELTVEARKGFEIGSIMKSRTFTPASSHKDFIFSQLSHNVENACERARFMGVSARAITFYLKTQEFRYKSLELQLPIPTSAPSEILKIISAHFNQLHKEGVLYRASGITLRGLIEEGARTYDLFGHSTANEHRQVVFKAVDKMNAKFGAKTVFLGSSFATLLTHNSHTKKYIEKDIRRINIPLLGIAIG